MLRKTISAFRVQLRSFMSSLMHEGLGPGEAATAVFVGVFIAHIPIYGFQALAALGIAAFFGLNKPLTVGATFINNPLTQPVLIFASVVLGQFLLTGKWEPGIKIDMSLKGLKEGFATFMVGSLLLGVILSVAGAGIVFVLLRLRVRGRADYVNTLYSKQSRFDRGFVRWKLRLDRIFDLLASEDLGTGTAVDLGCGYGIGLAFVAFDQAERSLVGCDLDRKRIAVAQSALAQWRPALSVEDVRSFPIPPANLILILDVLQYLDAREQMQLLARCAAALEPGGKLVFRVHDIERGLLSWLSMAFDRVIFLVGGVARRPLMLHSHQYRDALESAGLVVEARHMRNRLPLAHLVFFAAKPGVGGRG